MAKAVIRRHPYEGFPTFDVYLAFGEYTVTREVMVIDPTADVEMIGAFMEDLLAEDHEYWRFFDPSQSHGEIIVPDENGRPFVFARWQNVDEDGYSPDHIAIQGRDCEIDPSTDEIEIESEDSELAELRNAAD